LGSALTGEHQACLSGDAFSGDVEGGAVVDRDPDHGEADSDVHPVVAVDGLERRMALVVIAGDDNVPLAADGAVGKHDEPIGVAGLNPHAGENRIFGDEDADVLEPAVARARERGINAHGPIPADALIPAPDEGSGQGQDVVRRLGGAIRDGLL